MEHQFEEDDKDQETEEIQNSLSDMLMWLSETSINSGKKNTAVLNTSIKIKITQVEFKAKYKYTLLYDTTKSI